MVAYLSPRVDYEIQESRNVDCLRHLHSSSALVVICLFIYSCNKYLLSTYIQVSILILDIQM